MRPPQLFGGLEHALVHTAQQDHRRMRFVPGQMPQKLDAVHARHVQIANDHVDGGFVQPLEGRRSVVRLERGVDLELVQDALHQIDHELVVVDDQNLQITKGNCHVHTLVIVPCRQSVAPIIALWLFVDELGDLVHASAELRRIVLDRRPVALLAGPLERGT